MLSDFRLAARSLRRQPTFVSAVVLTLTLGLGATIAIYSLVDAALFRRLPFAKPDGIVLLWGVAGPERNVRGASFPEAFDWRDRNRTLEALSIYDENSLNLRTDDGAVRVQSEMVSASFFSILGAKPQLGRTFRADEDRVADRDAVAVISDAMWQERFGGSPTVLGRTLNLNDRPFTVVGVMSPGFKGLSFDTDVWVPTMMVSIYGSSSILTTRGTRYLGALARLKPDVSTTDAQRDLDRVASQLATDFPETNTGRGVQLFTLDQYYLGSTAQLLVMLLGAVGLLLLIACANVASLQLVRATSRAREVALRLALGASQSRIGRHVLAESLLLAFVGGIAGIIAAVWGANALLPLIPDGVLPPFATPRIDLRVLAFALLLCTACGVLIGLVPIWRSSRRDPGLALKAGARASSGGIGSLRNAGAQQLFVIGQIAIALVLLVGAGLVTRSLSRQLAVDPGVRVDGVFAARLSLPRSRYSPEARMQFVDRLTTELAQLPQVRSSAVGSDLPLRQNSSAATMVLDGMTEPFRFYAHRVTPGYFATLGIPLQRGRSFSADDRVGAPPVVVVTEAMVRRFWPNRDPIGARVRLGGPTGPEATVVGVVGTASFRGITANPFAPNSEPDVFFPYAQRTDADIEVAVQARDGDPSLLLPAIREAVKRVDPTLPIFNASPLSDNLRRQTASARFASVAMGAFSLVALILAALGIYGIMAYLVSIGRREIAIRLALGATGITVVRETVKHALVLAGVGIVIGLAGAAASSRLLGTLLFGVTPLDTLTFIGVSALVVATAVGASYLPSRRASRIDPQEALRAD